MSKYHAIITVPHAVGRSEPLSAHDYDVIALPVAELLAGVMPLPFDLIVGNIDRDMMDLNRCESRDSPFRRKVRNVVLAALATGVTPIVIDVHSFPPGHHKYGPFDVCLLSFESGHRTPCELQQHLRADGFSAGCFEHEIADILLDTSRLGADGVLVEVNEACNSGERWTLVRSLSSFFDTIK